MKEFSHPSVEKTPTDLNRAIQSTITVATNEWKYVAEMETDFDPGLPIIPCVPGEFNQVILNMIVNAAHAIAEKQGLAGGERGRISVSTRLVDDEAEIVIEDNGTGIPEDIVGRIFDPFFTTKQVGKGTGQGLCIAHNAIVKRLGGTLSVESQIGIGTRFIIRLPVAERTIEVAAA
jgi:signal transduction histidine kinase